LIISGFFQVDNSLFLLLVCSVSDSAILVCFVDGTTAQQATLPAVASSQPHSVITLLTVQQRNKPHYLQLPARSRTVLSLSR
jgi:hypothetical protein